MGKQRDLDAAERALGTLPRKPRESTADRRAREAWEQRLAALLRPVEPVAPPPGMFARISEHLGHRETRLALSKARRSTRRWKGFAILGGLATAGLCALLLVPGIIPSTGDEQAGARYVAGGTAETGGPAAMVVEVDTRLGTATVIPVGISAPEGRAFEMWHVPADGTAPVSLGLLPDDPALRRDVAARPGDAIAISVEQPGGSPTGQPTVAPRYIGTIQVVE